MAMLSRFIALPVANLNRVTIADEWHDHTDDSAFTNAGARSALRFAADAAEMVGDDAAPTAAWRQLAERLTIIYNETTKVVAECATPTIAASWVAFFSRWQRYRC